MGGISGCGKQADQTMQVKMRIRERACRRKSYGKGSFEKYILALRTNFLPNATTACWLLD